MECLSVCALETKPPARLLTVPMTDPILDNLNPQQFEAVTAPDGPLLIVAGAGTGKTRVITRRLAFLVRERGVQPYQVFAATFTNKAAQEMKRRVGELLEESRLTPGEFHISTFHSMCARILRREAVAIGLSPDFTICDDRDQVSAVKHVMKVLGISEKELKPADAQHVINQCKMQMLGPESVSEVTSSQFEEQYADIYRAYEKYLAECSAVDFEDLILKTVRMFRQNEEVLNRYRRRYRHVMVDEYQDTNAVQAELVFLIAGEHRNLAVVGDEDQSIYSWRGADITNLLDFQKHFPEAKIIRLEQNYRSTGNILKAASQVISKNTERLGKTLFTAGGDGAPLYVIEAHNETDESRAVAYAIEELTSRKGYGYGDVAIFYRVGALSRIFEDRMREFRFPYRVIGGIKFYERAEIKDMIAYLQLVANPHNNIAMLRIINTPRRGIGDKTVQSIIDWGQSRGVSAYSAMREIIATDQLPKGTAGKIGNFLAQINEWYHLAREARPSEVYQRVLEETNYIAALGDPKSLENQSRIDNLEELLSSILLFEKENALAGLNGYLENVSLVSVTDDLDPDAPAISLMTLHAAKGLEYKIVFLVGMEDGIFPSTRSVMDRGDYEEERRLFYVGITRAREVLVMSRAQSRIWYGEVRYNQASGFLRELPSELLAPLDPYNPIFGAGDGGGEETQNWADGLRRRRGEGYQPPAAPVYGHPSSRVSLDQPRAEAAEPAVRSSFRGISLGTRVRHPLLGDGVITGLSGSGNETKFVFQGDDGGMYELLARHARLEVIAES